MRTKNVALQGSFVALLACIGCSKPVSIRSSAPPPSAPEPSRAPAPVASRPTILGFNVEPSSIEPGQCASIRWNVKDATEVTITPEVGRVGEAGNRCVYPIRETRYKLEAKNETANAAAVVSVSMIHFPPAPEPSSAENAPARRLATDAPDVYFDYNSVLIRPEARESLSHTYYVVQAILKEYPKGHLVIEGNCDERGSAEYNLALGDQRAATVRDFLVGLGAPGERLETISWGKERPACAEHSEACWQQNRRVHFSPAN